MIFKKIPALIYIGLLILSSDIYAAYPETAQDFALLPPYCKAKLKPSSPAETELWAKRLGHDFGHTHHFCAALHSIRVANNIFATNADSKMDKVGLYKSALGDIKYMEEKADPNYMLFPDIYTSKAEALFALDQPGEAVGYLTKAINKNNKFTKAYSLLANYYLKIGNKKSAKETLEEGLKYSPNSKVLKNKLDKLSKE